MDLHPSILNCCSHLNRWFGRSQTLCKWFGFVLYFSGTIRFGFTLQCQWNDLVQFHRHRTLCKWLCLVLHFSGMIQFEALETRFGLAESFYTGFNLTSLVSTVYFVQLLLFRFNFSSISFGSRVPKSNWTKIKQTPLLNQMISS